MITTRMFAEMSGISALDAKILLRGHSVGGVCVGHTFFIDEDDLERYVEDVLAGQVEKLERKKMALDNLRKYLEEAENDPDTIDDFVTVSQAAEICGVSEPTIRQRLHGGQYRGRKFGTAWFIRKDSIDELRDDEPSTPINPLAVPSMSSNRDF